MVKVLLNIYNTNDKTTGNNSFSQNDSLTSGIWQMNRQRFS